MVTVIAVAPSTAIVTYLYILRGNNQPMITARTTTVAVSSATLRYSEQQKWQRWQQHWEECADSNRE